MSKRRTIVRSNARHVEVSYDAAIATDDRMSAEDISVRVALVRETFYEMPRHRLFGQVVMGRA